MEKEINSKNSFWYLIAESDLFEMVEKSGYGEHEFLVFQKRRLRNSIFSGTLAIVPAILVNPYLLSLGLFFFIYNWRKQYTDERREYQDNLFEKQVSWYYFIRLIASFVVGHKESVYVVFNKIQDRLPEGSFKDNTNKLLIDITDNPNKLEPYITFANNAAGGTDESLTFMTAFYNYVNYSNDGSIVDELCAIAKEQMKRGTTEIRMMKERHFYFYPTKLTMLNTIPIFGFVVSIAVYVMTNGLNF